MDPGSKTAAGWTGVTGSSGRQRAGTGNRAVGGRQRIQQKAEIVDERIVSAEARADGGLAVAEDVPGKADPGENSFVALFCVNAELPTSGVVTSTPVASVI